MSNNPKKVLLIEWPDCQRIMNHPEAKLVNDNHKIFYIIPPSIWYKYKNTFYINNDQEDDFIHLENNYKCQSCQFKIKIDKLIHCNKCHEYFCELCINNLDLTCQKCKNK